MPFSIKCDKCKLQTKKVLDTFLEIEEKKKSLPPKPILSSESEDFEKNKKKF